MGCLFAIFAGLFPRIAVILMWLANPSLFGDAFDDFWLWPILGVIFLPFMTLIYVIAWDPITGFGGIDWLWLILALLIDLSGWGGSGYANRDRFGRRPVA